MNTPDTLASALDALLRELIDGAAPTGGWILNRGDEGLLASLDRIQPEEASRVPDGGSASVAAHVAHVRFGLELLNRASAGENPFHGADWTAAWRRNEVSGEEWSALRQALREEAHRWRANAPALFEGGSEAVTGVIASAAHLAYHLGAIRQISRTTRGPSAEAV